MDKEVWFRFHSMSWRCITYTTIRNFGFQFYLKKHYYWCFWYIFSGNFKNKLFQICEICFNLCVLLIFAYIPDYYIRFRLLNKLSARRVEHVTYSFLFFYFLSFFFSFFIFYFVWNYG